MRTFTVRLSLTMFEKLQAHALRYRRATTEHAAVIIEDFLDSDDPPISARDVDNLFDLKRGTA